MKKTLIFLITVFSICFFIYQAKTKPREVLVKYTNYQPKEMSEIERGIMKTFPTPQNER